MKNLNPHQEVKDGSKCFPLRKAIAITAILFFLTQAGFGATGSVNFNSTYRQIEGFGGAACYDASTLTGRSYRETVYDYLFRDLGLDVLRIKNTYDFDMSNVNATATIVAEGKERNPALKTELVPWSPPTGLKNPATLSGGTLKGGPSAYVYDDYATYWVNSMTAWADVSVHPDYISIQNEPDWTDLDQACRFDPTETANGAGYDQAFEHVYQALYAQLGASMPKMIGPESTGYSAGSNGAPGGSEDYIAHFIDANHVYGFSFHLYGDGDYSNPEAYVTSMDYYKAHYSDKPLFMTEFVADGTPTLDHAVQLAWHIHNCLYHLGVTSYYHWSLFRSYGDGGLINISSSSSYIVRDLYWFFKGYAYFTDPNWYVVDVTTNPSDNLRMSAFKNPANDKLTVVILNKSASSESLTLDLNGCNVTGSAMYRSSASEHWLSLGTFSNPVSLPAQSITTIAFNVTQQPTHSLTTSSTTGGTVTTPGEGTFNYVAGTDATIIASADLYYRFLNWTGTAADNGKVDDVNAANTIVLMDANYTVVANFIPDDIKPTPDPMTWASVPTKTGESKITMTATTAADAESPPVQYYFECTNHPEANSVWQSSPTYLASGLTPSTLYSFRVKARDSAFTPNVTAPSSTQSATTDPPDLIAPTPNPTTWATVPTATSSSTITMTATTATDANTPPVQYYFECTTDGTKTSGWQSSPTYVAEGLNPNTSYTFRAKARDSAIALNETGWSSELSATTDPPSAIISIIGSWVAGLTHAKEAGPGRGLIFIAHAEHSSSNLNLTSVTYGGQAMTKVIDINTGNNSRVYVAAFILKEPGIAAATNGTFVPSWTPTPSEVEYASVFLRDVNQINSIGETGSNGTANPSPNPIEISAGLATNDGDMVIEAATCGNAGNYTLNYGFIEGIDQAMASSTGVTGYKAATGAVEYPSATFNSGPNRQVIIGFVLNAGNPPPVAPTGLVATAGNGTVSLDWNNNSEFTLAGYNVYRSTTSGSGYSKLNVSLVPSSDYIDNTVTNGLIYYYVVTAVDIIGQESGYSNEAPVRPDIFQNCPQVQAGDYDLLSDLNGDCYVNYLDLGIVAYYWLHTDCAGLDNCGNSDFEPDGDVDFTDFSTFSLQWRFCNDPPNLNCQPNWP